MHCECVSDLDEIRQQLNEREAKLKASEEENRKQRALLEQDKAAFARVDALRASAKTRPNPPINLDDDDELLLAEPSSESPYGFFKRAVRESIKMIAKPEFTSSEIADVLRLTRPDLNVEANRANISAYFKDFLQEGIIEQITPGAGRRPAIYRKK